MNQNHSKDAVANYYAHKISADSLDTLVKQFWDQANLIETITKIQQLMV